MITHPYQSPPQFVIPRGSKAKTMESQEVGKPSTTVLQRISLAVPRTVAIVLHAGMRFHGLHYVTPWNEKGKGEAL